MKSKSENNTSMQTKEKIALKKFKTMDALKSEIRDKIATKKYAKIASNGPFISILFEKNGF